MTRLAAAQLGLVHARLQHLHRGGAVAVLAAVGLAGDDDAGRDMRDADGALGLVDVLTAGTGGAERVDLQVRLGSISISMLSSTTGYTHTLAKLVWRRALESNGLIRTSRCTPASVFSQP